MWPLKKTKNIFSKKHCTFVWNCWKVNFGKLIWRITAYLGILLRVEVTGETSFYSKAYSQVKVNEILKKKFVFSKYPHAHFLNNLKVLYVSWKYVWIWDGGAFWQNRRKGWRCSWSKQWQWWNLNSSLTVPSSP